MPQTARQPTRQPAARRLLTALLAAAAILAFALPATAAAPYVETKPARGFHPFTRPKKKNPADQWAYTQQLNQRGKLRAAARHAYALRLYWPQAPEAPAAQMLNARILEQRRLYLDAFDSYQHLIEHYPGRFDFNEVIGRQLALANTIMTLKKGKFLFIPGFTAPERAIPLFETIVTNAPEWAGTAEALYHIGTANEHIYEYEKAIDAYFATLYRFPDSPFAEKAARNQVLCHIKISNDSPQDNRAIETAIAACDFFLARFPDSEYRGAIQSSRETLQTQRAQNAYSRARYYDKILRRPDAALIEYNNFLAQFPDSPQAPAARKRVAALTGKPVAASPRNAPAPEK